MAVSGNSGYFHETLRLLANPTMALASNFLPIIMQNERERERDPFWRRQRRNEAPSSPAESYYNQVLFLDRHGQAADCGGGGGGGGGR